MHETMVLLAMSDDNSYFLFEDKNLQNFVVCTLQNKDKKLEKEKNFKSTSSLVNDF